MQRAEYPASGWFSMRTVLETISLTNYDHYWQVNDVPHLDALIFAGRAIAHFENRIWTSVTKASVVPRRSGKRRETAATRLRAVRPLIRVYTDVKLPQVDRGQIPEVCVLFDVDQGGTRFPMKFPETFPPACTWAQTRSPASLAL